MLRRFDSLVFAVSLLSCIATSCTLFGQEEAKLPLSVKPEVQTAEWAKAWWMPRHEEKLKEKEKMGTVDLLWIGDSITHGWEGGGKATWEKYYTKRKPLNIGFSGDRTENVLWRLNNGAVDGIAPKVTVIMIGTNNAGHRQDSSEDIAAGISEIIKTLRQKLPETKIVLLAIFPRGADNEDALRKLNNGANEIIKGFAKDNEVYFVDINASFLDAQGKLPKEIMPDLLHPNEEGYRLWAEALEPTLVKLMGE
jgi:lysophospholipase L1-like esterase